MVSIRIAPLAGSAVGLVDAARQAASLEDFFVRIAWNYTGFNARSGRWEFDGLMRGTVPALIGNGIGWGARQFGFQGNIVRTKRFKLSVF